MAVPVSEENKVQRESAVFRDLLDQLELVGLQVKMEK